MKAYAYRRAIQQLKMYPRKITRLREARKVSYIGPGILDKIRQVLQRGCIMRVVRMDEDPARQSIREFLRIWGTSARARPHALGICLWVGSPLPLAGRV